MSDSVFGSRRQKTMRWKPSARSMVSRIMRSTSLRRKSSTIVFVMSWMPAASISAAPSAVRAGAPVPGSSMGSVACSACSVRVSCGAGDPVPLPGVASRRRMGEPGCTCSPIGPREVGHALLGERAAACMSAR